ncbi:hypothetical protein L596_016795 [Steinernema carpocapsae]|uniref:Uncharacterized protein n=1 Tax=Steinernema carpocapsae TaxID=34508 RepID=A0A4U5NK51_STECR|nr:hypothetical protein L596_016795 [Steinernema carpocapsae]
MKLYLFKSILRSSSTVWAERFRFICERVIRFMDVNIENSLNFVGIIHGTSWNWLKRLTAEWTSNPFKTTVTVLFQARPQQRSF